MKKDIVVIGGGTSGWLSACMFLKVFGSDYNATVIADESIGNIGVGEATIPCIKEVFNFLDISEKDWLQYCDGSLKYGISFEGWNQEKDFTHPYYDSIGDENYEGFLKYWSFLKTRDIIHHEFDEISGILPYMMKEKLYSKDIINDTAYHFDTGKLGQYLKQWALDRGAKYINGHVSDFIQNEVGDITEIVLKDKQKITVDFVIDCSGFKSLVLEGVHKQEFISFEDELLCDSCVVRWFDYSDTEQQRVPYTSAIAMDFGWMWKIPLEGRLSVGYVFSKKYINSDQAQGEMMKKIDLKPVNDFRTVYFKTGYHKESWKKNSIAIGLSYGFIEPLESTGIFLIYSSLFQAIETFKHIDSTRKENKIGKYNAFMESLIHDIKNFVLYHYVLNEKEGIFWEDAKSVKYPIVFDELGVQGQEKEKYFGYDIYHRNRFQKEPFFKNLSYYYILTGMREFSLEETKIDINSEKLKQLIYVFKKREEKLHMKIQENMKYDTFLKQYYNK